MIINNTHTINNINDLEDNIISSINNINNKLNLIENDISYKLKIIENNIQSIKINNINNNRINYSNFMKLYKHLLIMDFTIIIIVIPLIYTSKYVYLRNH